MSFYQRHVLPRLVHLAMRQKQLVPFRRRVIGAAEGRVLEIGIGSGLNLPLYGSTVRAVFGLEPSPELLRMARERSTTTSVPIEFLEASAETIPLDDGSVDTVVTTWTLCTIPDAPLPAYFLARCGFAYSAYRSSCRRIAAGRLRRRTRHRRSPPDAEADNEEGRTFAPLLPNCGLSARWPYGIRHASQCI